MDEPKKKVTACGVCRHPYADFINTWIAQGLTYSAMQATLARLAPQSKFPSEASISRHRTHVVRLTDFGEKPLPSASAPRLEDGLPDVEPIKIADALQAIVRAGLSTIQRQPERVSVKDLIEALKMLEAMGQGGGDSAEYNQAWQDLAKRRSQEAKTTTTTTTEEVKRVVIEQRTKHTQQGQADEEEGPAELIALPLEPLPDEVDPAVFTPPEVSPALIDNSWTPPNWGEDEEQIGTP